MIRGVRALATLDLGSAEEDVLRATIDAKLERYGVDARAVAFTKVSLPAQLTASLEAQRLSAIQLDEQAQAYLLDQRRLLDQANLVAQEAAARRNEVELEASAEALRLAKLEERLAANPNAARYDLDLARIRVAQQLAGNARAVVSMGAGDLATTLLVAREAAGCPAGSRRRARNPGLPHDGKDGRRDAADGLIAAAGRVVRTGRIIAAVLLGLVGLVWLGQGIGLIGGSAMSGSVVWAVIGAGLLAAGIVIGVLEARRR